MERETVEGLRLGTTFPYQLLVVVLLVFWYAVLTVTYSLKMLASEHCMKTAELRGLRAGETDMPLASLWHISREGGQYPK